MRKIVLISCVSMKLAHKALAQDLYTSPLFKYNLNYARSLRPDVIYILSAKYGLVELEQLIEPYNVTLKDMGAREVQEWSSRVLAELQKRADLRQDLFIFLAGENYRKYLVPHLAHYEIPMKGKSIGRQLKFLKEQFHE